MLNKLKRLAWLRVGLSILFAAVIALVATLAVHSLSGKPRILTSIDARTEFISFTVFNPDLAILYAQGFKIVGWPDETLENQCAEGAFLPGIGSKVTYQRIDKGSLVAIVEGEGKLRKSSGEIVPFEGELVLIADPQCNASLLSNRLPVWGPGRIGSVFAMRADGPSPTLLSGTIDVFGRTVAVPFWGSGGAIYVAIEDMAIPAGSLIQTDALTVGDTGSPASNSEAAMFGFVELSDDSGLSISVSTESPELSITPPGAKADSNRIDLSLFVQVVNDPVFLKIQLFLALAFLLWPAIMDAINLAHSRSGEETVEKSALELSNDGLLIQNTKVLN
ncbi:hypothetical protein [Agrobacterium vaccinii]|uniref:hypothetical protein n=1 Tax=Agrobacterium vaccinii TaxID=2735528 RepID=UPI001E29DE2A|nr:hypothetical protein [Agrobacterium vaccinii]UHS59192.1 hypothetical protein HRS00_20410 [Agrobacterium vaccinii]